MRFLLLGDIHCYGHYVFDAIKKVGAPLDAVVSVGDLTNTGGQIEVESVAGAVKSGLDAIGCSATPFIACMGNHDYGNKVNSDEENALCRSRFESVVGVPFRHIANIKGYTFITFSARNHSASYTEEDYAQLDNNITIAENQSSDLPVFIVCHYSSGGTGLYGDVNAKGGPLDNILKKHPRAILLSGHSHAYLANERSLMQSESGYHNINAGSLWQSAKADAIQGNVTGYYIPAVTIAQCDGGNITFRRFNTEKEEYIGQPWTITPNCDNSLTGRSKSLPLPRFTGEEVKISNIGAESVIVTYPKANGQTEYYKAEAISESGEVVSAQFTSYYFMPKAEDGRMEISGLSADTKYDLSVYPVDFYGRVGDAITGSFKTMPQTTPSTDLIYDGGITPEMWTGDIQNIRDEVGFATDSDDSTPYIISADGYNFADGFQVFATNNRNQYNNDGKDFSCLQVGRFTAATCRTKEGNRMALLQDWQINDGNPFESDLVVAEVTLPYAIGEQVLGLTLEDGKLTLWRDKLPAITIDATPEKEAVKIALRLGETWGVFTNCATFSHIKIAR